MTWSFSVYEDVTYYLQVVRHQFNVIVKCTPTKFFYHPPRADASLRVYIGNIFFLYFFQKSLKLVCQKLQQITAIHDFCLNKCYLQSGWLACLQSRGLHGVRDIQNLLYREILFCQIETSVDLSNVFPVVKRKKLFFLEFENNISFLCLFFISLLTYFHHNFITRFFRFKYLFLLLFLYFLTFLLFLI